MNDLVDHLVLIMKNMDSKAPTQDVVIEITHRVYLRIRFNFHIM